MVIQTSEVFVLKLILIFSFFALVGCTSPSVKTEATARPLVSTLSCREGTIRRGFMTPITQGDLPCAEGVQTCVSGIWQGPMLYDSCENHNKSCSDSPHGSVVNGYSQLISPKGISCTPTSKTCLNGAWVGPEVFTSCSEL